MTNNPPKVDPSWDDIDPPFLRSCCKKLWNDKGVHPTHSHIAVLTDGKKKISCRGCSQAGTNFITGRKGSTVVHCRGSASTLDTSCHAEIAVMKCLKPHAQARKKLTIYSLKIGIIRGPCGTRYFKFRSARPCINCAIAMSGKISKVVYTDFNGELVCTTPRELLLVATPSYANRLRNYDSLYVQSRAYADLHCGLKTREARVNRGFVRRLVNMVDQNGFTGDPTTITITNGRGDRFLANITSYSMHASHPHNVCKDAKQLLRGLFNKAGIGSILPHVDDLNQAVMHMLKLYRFHNIVRYGLVCFDIVHHTDL